MLFGEFNIEETENSILAHSIRLKGQTFKKGRRLSMKDISLMKEAGITSITCAQLEAGDIQEDEAADKIASTITGRNLTKGVANTGRSNIYARKTGLVSYRADHINLFNSLNEAITLGLVANLQHVNEGQMVATLKIIPFAISGGLLETVTEFSNRTAPLFDVIPYEKRRVILIQTYLTGMKETILDSTYSVTNDRLKELGAELIEERRCSHNANVLGEELRISLRKDPDILLIAGGSAIVDRRDVVPSAIELANGEISHFGMPVDPGNLILLAAIGSVPIIGIPGCARSPKLNGFDWVLQRTVANLPVTSRDVMSMGAGGLLKDIPRPLPRSRVSRLGKGTSRDDQK